METISPPGVSEGVGFVQLGDDTAGIRCAGGLQGLQGAVLGFLDVGADYVGR
ncbi:hypothetical protein J7I79_16660 [Arthrobacter sp. ISL-69]|nr:hypothetical protein [Arthrobacter sp. ISL-69]